MKATRVRLARASLAAAVIVGSAMAAAQVVIGGTGFITVSIAAVGAVGGGITGEARLPVTASGARLDSTNNHATISAVGRRGAVRRIELDVSSARQGQRHEVGPAGAAIHLTLEPNTSLDASRGWIQFDTLTPQRGVGRYEGTFQNGQTPMVVRGQFQVNFSPAVGAPPGGANPGPGPVPPQSHGVTQTDAGRRSTL